MMVVYSLLGSRMLAIISLEIDSMCGVLKCWIGYVRD